MRPATEVVKALLQTEKGARVAAHNQYVLEVALNANKIEIRDAVKHLFGATVTKVTTQTLHGKWRRLQARWGKRTDRKKAFVTLADGQKLDVKP